MRGLFADRRMDSAKEVGIGLTLNRFRRVYSMEIWNDGHLL